MAYRAIAFDMDGTLLNDQGLILSDTVTAISRIKNKGIKILLVTGRHHSVVYPYHHQLNLTTTAVCCNGAYLYDFAQKKSLYDKPLTKDQAKQVVELADKFNVHILIYTDQSIIYRELNKHLKALLKWIDNLPHLLKPAVKQIEKFSDAIDDARYIYKFATSNSNVAKLKAFTGAIVNRLDLECEWSWYNRADITSKGTNKGNGLTTWALTENITLPEIVAFGDHHNDISMLSNCGLGIAMENADYTVKEKADITIGDNNKASIADALNDLFP